MAGVSIGIEHEGFGRVIGCPTGFEADFVFADFDGPARWCGIADVRFPIFDTRAADFCVSWAWRARWDDRNKEKLLLAEAVHGEACETWMVEDDFCVDIFGYYADRILYGRGHAFGDCTKYANSKDPGFHCLMCIIFHEPVCSRSKRGKKPQIRFALSRGFTVSGWIPCDFTRGGARRLACPGLLSSALPGLSVCGFADN
jgi:hypothetical protein